MEITGREIGGIVVIDIEGEIRRSEASQVTLSQMVKAELERGKKDIVLDLSGVSFVDSFGVGEILASYVSTQDIGGRFGLSGVQRKVLVVFEVTMLTKILKLYDTLEKALAALDET